jgi:alkyl hydroperoxide reductase subunit F
MLYDLAILGGGPAGVAAGVYAARKRLKTVFITKDFESQSVVSPEIQNWIGSVTISGADLAKSFKKHLLAYASDCVELHEGHWVKGLEKIEGGFKVTTDKTTFEAKAILIATGSRRRKLEVTGADIYEHKGITYCASCDGPVFAGQDVAVIGGGNAAFDAAAQLLAYCKSVTLFNRSEKYRADEITIKAVLAHPNMKAITNARLDAVTGGKFADALTYTDSKTNTQHTLPVGGIFVEIGSLPNTEFLKGVVELDAYNHIVTDPRTQKTSVAGIWAAGDCTDGLYHQNNIAAGDGVTALEDIYLALRAK